MPNILLDFHAKNPNKLKQKQKHESVLLNQVTRGGFATNTIWPKINENYN